MLTETMCSKKYLKNPLDIWTVIMAIRGTIVTRVRLVFGLDGLGSKLILSNCN